MIVSEAHEKRVQGFPLDSLSIDIDSGKYYYDLKDKSVAESVSEEGLKEFFAKALLQ